MKTISKSFITGIILISVAFTGCKKDPVGLYSDEYFPNSIGNSWVYHRFDSLAMEQTSLQVDILRDTLGSDGLTYRMWVFSKSNIYDTLYVRTLPDSVKFYRYPEGYPVDVMVIPLSVGQSWQHPIMVRDSSKVVSVETLTVNSFTFENTYLIHHRIMAFNDYLSEDRWFVPHVGLVKLENWHYLFGWISKENWSLAGIRVN